jgi:hypothetical protein
MSKFDIFFIFIVSFLSSISSFKVLAQVENDTNGNTDLSTEINNINASPNNVTTSDLNTNSLTNQGIISYPSSAFSSSSSFSGYSSFGSQCGFSISGGYINNGFSDAFQILSTFNTNPCVDQSELENTRQEHESKREVIRANAQIITTCINARVQASQSGINPDTICKLNDFELPRNP